MSRSTRVVRASKFRHVFCEPDKPTSQFLDIDLAPHTGDHFFVSASPKFFSVAVRGGGGKVLVQPLTEPGKVLPEKPTVQGHKGKVYDTQWNPFNDNVLATASADNTVKVWLIPDGGLTEPMNDSVATLDAHSKEVLLLQWHPLASNVLASTSRDTTVKIWDVEKSADKLTLPALPGLVSDFRWNATGSLLSTACKDKMIRVHDPRTNTVAAEWMPHDNAKVTNTAWITDKEGHFLTAGFTKQSHRELKFWDIRNPAEALYSQRLDQSAGVLMPFYDEDTKILFVGGKGDANVRYFELVNEEPFIHPIDEFRSADTAKGMCMLPKRACDVMRCEIARFYKLTNDCAVVGLSFIVPRKSDAFQDDIFVDTRAGVPAQSADAYFRGDAATAKLMSLDPAKNGGITGARAEVKIDAEAAKAAADRRAAAASAAASSDGGAASGGGAAAASTTTTAARASPAASPVAAAKPTYEELEAQLAAARARIAELEAQVRGE